MQAEIEVKFLNVDHDKIRATLRELGAHLEQPMRLMRRTIFDFDDGRLDKTEAHFRVRDEGDKVTMTFKRLESPGTADGAKEIETTVGDYDTAVRLFRELGFYVKAQQESKRETWKINDCEVVLDLWPWVKPYLEIEGPSEQAIRNVAAKLGFDWDRDARFGSVTGVYRAEYAIPEEVSIAVIPVIAFNDPLPEYLAKLKRTKE